MATTVIDALTIELGLNPAPFVKGQKAAVTAFTQTKKEAVSAGKQIEESSNKAADGIARIAKEAAALGALFIGFKGLKDFIGDLIGADAALGRFAANLGQSPQMISSWGMAAERFGGSAQATQKTIESLGRAFYNLRYNGQMLPKEFYQLQAASGKVISTGGDLNRSLGDTAVAIKKVYDANPARAKFLAEGMGIDEGTFNLMVRFGSSTSAFASALQRLAPTQADIAASQDLQEHWFALTQTATNLADTLLRTLEPSLEPILKGMSDWIEKNRDWLAGEVSTKVKEFATWIQAINWYEIGTGVTTFATELGKVATALEVIAALLVAGKIAGGLKGLFGGGSGVDLGGGIIAGLVTSFGLFAQGDANYRASHPHGDAPSVYGRGGAAVGGRGRVRTYGPGRSPTGGAPSAYIEQPNTPYGSFTRDPSAHGDALVDGKPVSKANPMPVTITDTPSVGSGGGLWDTVKSLFGISSASAGTLPSGLAHKASFSSPGAAAGTVSTSGSNKEVVDYIRQAAISRGIDPNTALTVAASEGLRGYDPTKPDRGGDDHTSFGPYQLHMGGLSSMPGMGGRGLGDAFRQATGLDPRNPSTWKAQVDFALEYAKHHGWGSWNGAKAHGIYGFHGIGGKEAFNNAPGARMAANLSSIQQTRNVTSSTSSNEMHVGAININAPNATDSEGIASSISSSLTRSFQAMPANYGLV